MSSSVKLTKALVALLKEVKLVTPAPVDTFCLQYLAFLVMKVTYL